MQKTAHTFLADPFSICWWGWSVQLRAIHQMGSATRPAGPVLRSRLPRDKAVLIVQQVWSEDGRMEQRSPLLPDTACWGKGQAPCCAEREGHSRCLGACRKCEGHDDAVRVLAVAGGKVFSGSYDGSIGVW